MLRYIRRFYRKICIILQWFPIICKDNDWDYWYILVVLRHKIRRTYKVMDKCKHHYSHEKDLKDMRVVLTLLNRFLDGEHEYTLDSKLFCTCKKPRVHFEVDEQGVWKNPFCDWCKKYGMKQEAMIETAQWDYMFEIIRKRMKHWWC